MPRCSRSLLLLPIALLSACAPVVVVHSHRPPPDRVEVIGVAPYAGAHWVRGHWVLRRGEWVWMPGHWSHRVYYY